MEKEGLFLNKLFEDKDLQALLIAAVQTAATKEEKVNLTTKVASEAGFEVSADKLKKLVEAIQNEPAKLSDDDLGNVAGGSDLIGGFSNGFLTVNKLAFNSIASGPVVSNAVTAGNAIAGTATDAGNAIAGTATDAGNAIAGAATDTGNAIAGAATDTGKAIASVFSGW